MKLSDKLNELTICFPKSTCKNDIMHELLDHFYKLNYLTATEKLFSYLDDQEKKLNSASGRGVAYHYHTSIEVKETLSVLGISKSGIDYQASDGLRCHFILLILEPKDKPTKHRKLINFFQDLIKNSNVKSQILKVNSSKEAEQIIKNWEEDEGYNLL